MSNDIMNEHVTAVTNIPVDGTPATRNTVRAMLGLPPLKEPYGEEPLSVTDIEIVMASLYGGALVEPPRDEQGHVDHERVNALLKSMGVDTESICYTAPGESA